MSKPTLVIGDVHGHLDRLEALLLQEGVIGRCPDCDGNGDVQCDDGGWSMCEYCRGDGLRRINFNVEVIQLGDLGHFGEGSSPTGDELCYAYAGRWLDKVIWGNHDWAVNPLGPTFKGYLKPRPAVFGYMKQLHKEGRLVMAHSSHGYLFTHAGLHAHFKQSRVSFDRTNPEKVVAWLNENDNFCDPYKRLDLEAKAMINSVSQRRNGGSTFGGVLWRDRTEKLYDAFPQVFGHSADWYGRILRFNRRDIDDNGQHWCVDIGGKFHHQQRLGGIWIDGDEVRPVRVDLT